MSDQTASGQYSVPAGWYPDPLGHPQLRWWNGEGWTEQVSPAPEPLVMQQATYAWKPEEAAPVIVQVPAQTVQPAAPAVPAQAAVGARELFALEAPKAAAKIEQTTPVLPVAGYTSNYKQPAAGAAPAAAQPTDSGYTKYAVNANPELIPVPVTPANSAQPKFYNS